MYILVRYLYECVHVKGDYKNGEVEFLPNAHDGRVGGGGG
jgi:hypothetical protein